MEEQQVFRGGEMGVEMEVERHRNRNHDIIEVNRIRQQEKKKFEKQKKKFGQIRPTGGGSEGTCQDRKMAELAVAASSVLVLHSTVAVIVVAPHAGSSRHCF